MKENPLSQRLLFEIVYGNKDENIRLLSESNELKNILGAISSKVGKELKK